MTENRANKIQRFRKQQNRLRRLCCLGRKCEFTSRCVFSSCYNPHIAAWKPYFNFALSGSGANVRKLPLYGEKRILAGNLVFRGE